MYNYAFGGIILDVVFGAAVVGQIVLSLECVLKMFFKSPAKEKRVCRL